MARRALDKCIRRVIPVEQRAEQIEWCDDVGFFNSSNGPNTYPLMMLVGPGGSQRIPSVVEARLE